MFGTDSVRGRAEHRRQTRPRGHGARKKAESQMNPIAPFQSLLLRGAVVALGALASLLRHERESAAAASSPPLPREPWLAFLRAAAEPDPAPPAARTRPVRRIAATAGLAALFCLGAAFTAAAGDLSVGLLEDTTSPAAETTAAGPADDTPASGEATPPTTETTADEADAEPTRPGASLAPSGETPAAETPPPPAETPPAETAPAEAPAPEAEAAVIHRGGPAAVQTPAHARVRTHAHKQPARRRQARVRPEAPPFVRPLKIRRQSAALELDGHPIGATTVWLHRLLPDPTPPARRLTADFAQQLSASSRSGRVDWALVLGVLRARGETGSVPATRTELDTLAQQLAQAGAHEQPATAVLAITGDTATADSAMAMANLYRALGRAALVHGLEWAKDSLAQRLLHDEHVTIYAGGRADIEAERVDVRVLALIAYLKEEFGSIDVSCLISGHRLFARPGVVSAHIYGLAVDISMLGGTTILGHQEPGGITERAVRSILLLPPELRPRQVISLLGLGGPSFPLANHDDHIHVGY
jgi:hypothetical protein